MTTKAHTDVAVGAPANAATFNAPLGQLDNALVDYQSLVGDYVVTGGLAGTSASLTITQPACRAFVLNTWVNAAATTLTATASSDNYVDLDSSSAFHVTAVANGAVAPPLFANSIRLYKAVSSATAVTSVVDLRQTNPLGAKLNLGFFNVKDPAYGAKGDGTTDDSGAIAAAITAAVGGGIVFCPPGTYMVRQGQIQLTSFVTLMGAGRGATIIKLIASQAGTGQAPQATVIANKNTQTSGDVQMVVRDLTVDGNAANQGTGKNQGVAFYRCRAAKAINVRVQDIAGSGTTTNETFMFEVVAGADVEFVSCEAVNTSTQYSSGFSADSATNVQWVDCWAINTGGMGFTHHGSQNLQYTNCRAYLCAVDGFHSETGVDVTYANCISGGLASTNATSPVPWPFTSGQALGNAGQGFFLGVNGSRINVIGCVGAKNNGSGNSAGLLVNLATKVRIMGGSWHDNLGVGINFNAAVDAVNTRITGGPIIDTNTAGAWAIAGTIYAYPGGVTSPAVPATGVYIQNPFPFDANVWVTGGTVTSVFLANTSGGGAGVQLGGATPVGVRVPAGAFIAVNYTVAPTWNWWVD